jgi:hypothetical protein
MIFDVIGDLLRARLIFQFFFFLSLSLGIPHAGLKLPGFTNPTTETNSADQRRAIIFRSGDVMLWVPASAKTTPLTASAK